MKTASQLLTISVLALCTVSFAALAGCSAPTVPAGSEEGDGEDTDENEPAAKLPKNGKKASADSNNGGGKDNAGPPASTPATPPATPANPATPPTTPAPIPGGNADACMDQCAAKGPAAQYWTCSAVCQDEQCDDTCWNQSCGQNEQACESSLDACASQCGVDQGGGADPGAP